MRGDFAPNLKGIALIAPAWDMTRLFWERATPEIRGIIMRGAGFSAGAGDLLALALFSAFTLIVHFTGIPAWTVKGR